MSNSELFHGPAEDPLAGDVDTFVHPDETMSDAERAMAEKYPLEDWSEDSSENYWADYDAVHGTVHGGQPKAEMRSLEKHGYDTEIITSYGMKVFTTRESLKKDYPGMSTQEIADAMDLERQESEAALQEIERNIDTDNQDAEYDNYPYEDDLHDEPDEDPLAGDVDPTGGYYVEPEHPWNAHIDRVHREHGN